MSRIRVFFTRHPLLRDALLWATPALLFGAVLRLCMLHYAPYAYWGSDSRSYYEFAYKWYSTHDISLGEKRRGLYPILMALLTALPGAPLRNLAWLQHGFGLAVLWPLAYVVRKNFTFWKWWIIPVTLLYAGFPITLWYEHELLGETLFFSFLVCALAGWSAWAGEERRARVVRLWWCFFVPFACFILIRPAGRFYWPGLLLGLVLFGLWRKLTWPAAGGIAALIATTLLLGSEKLGAWLVYTADFPLTQLDTPLYADYKAQIRDLVQPLRADLPHYYGHDGVPFMFLENPDRSPERTLWAPLKAATKERIKIYRALAFEGAWAEPLNFLYLGLQRAVFSSNLSSFKEERFSPHYMPERFRNDYADALERAAEGNRSAVGMVLGYGRREPLPPPAEMEQRLSPAPDSGAARFIHAWVGGWGTKADLITAPSHATLSQVRPTVLGVWLLLSAVLSLTPRYRRGIGVWSLAAFGYLGGVFLVAQINPRYFGSVWPVFIPTLVVTADLLARGASHLRRVQHPGARNGLGISALLVFASSTSAPGAGTYPVTESVINVTQPPYSAKADGVSDDTEALQRAINEHAGQHHILYFPHGTYLVSATLAWPKNYGGHENWGMTFLRGETRETSIIRLRDGTFTDPDKPRAIMWCGGFGSADWFHNYVENLTFDVGAANPGAVALQFYSNNSGAVRNCRFRAAAGSGHTGLDLGHRDMNGPLLVRDCEVEGFRRGIATAGAVNSQVFEFIALRGQTQVGFTNEGQAISIRGLSSENAVPALSTYGTLCLLDARLTGIGAAHGGPALINYNGGRLFLRDVKTTGYGRALADVSRTPDSAAAFRVTGEDLPGSLGPEITEYCSQAAASLFPSPAHSPRLPIKETPDLAGDDPKLWANVNDFGADPTGKADSSAAIQQAMDSGAATIFFPGNYALKSTVLIRGKVSRLVGTGGVIDYFGQVKPDFRLSGGDSPTVLLEHFAGLQGGLEVDTARTLLLRSVADCDLTTTARSEGAEWFFEDVVTHQLALKRQKLWARQLNIENEGTHLSNDGGQVWILGYKTERGGSVLETRGGGSSEVLGGFSYTTTAGHLAPMFVNTASSVWAFFHEVCYSGDPFAIRVAETRGAETRTLTRESGHTTPYSGRP